MFLLAVALLVFTTSLTAQTQSRAERRARVDSVLSQRYYKTPYDTNYVVRPEGRLTLKVRMNQTGNSFHARGMVNDVYAKADLSTSHKTTFSLAAIYRGIGVGVAINPAKWGGAYKDYEFNLNCYSSRLSLDLSYQRSESLTGDMLFDEVPKRLEQGDATMKVLNVAAYYTFNHRRFSFPAAFTQSYIQRHSAGSFLLAFSGQGQRADTKATYESVLKVTNIGIGAGYGYNWVPARNWLLHISALPTFIVYSHTSLRVNEERIPVKYHFPEVIITSRGAIVKQFGNMFVGTSMVFNFTNIGDEEQLAVHNIKWRTRLFVGFRL